MFFFSPARLFKYKLYKTCETSSPSTNQATEKKRIAKFLIDLEFQKRLQFSSTGVFLRISSIGAVWDVVTVSILKFHF